jgi:hypothetical protein
MGSSRQVGADLLRFFSTVQSAGSAAALRELNLESLAGQPVEIIFASLSDFLCPIDGSIDQGIARDAFIEAIVELAGVGVTDLDSLSADQMLSVFEIFTAHAIEARICNDIGARIIVLPTSPAGVDAVENQLTDLIRRSVSDAIAAETAISGSLTPERISGFVERVYEFAFEFLAALAESEAET